VAKQRLELTWIGKDERPRLEPRILLEDGSLSYHAKAHVTDNDIFGNMLIHGDNLLALKALEQEFTGKVKCVFIDPPYNTGSAFEHYDDGVEHSIWLSLMRDRIELLRGLLSEDGSIWITIDDNEAHYLKVLCDEIFGRQNFCATIIWEKRTSRENRRVFSFNHDFMLVYANNKAKFEQTRNPLGLNDEVLSRYKNPDNDPRGPWQSVSANAQAGHATASQFYTLTLPSGRRVDPPKGRCWLYTAEKMQTEISAGNIWFGLQGDNAPRVKKFLSDYKDKGLTPETIWTAQDVSTNDEAKKSLIALLPHASVFDNPKPESLLKQVLQIATNPGDLVLDSFAGSGTTGAVAHKMGRRWIMVELGDHCETHIVPRLRKVIDGDDPGGITGAVEWAGGGGFRYYRLAPSLLEKDAWGNWVISKDYDAAKVAQAVCKLMGFVYQPDETRYWMQGRSSETDFIYVTTQSLTHEQLAAIAEEVGDERTLLVCCKAFRANADAFPNLTIRKIPQTVLRKCEWGKDDYSLNIANLPEAPDEPNGSQTAPKEGRKKGGKAARPLRSPICSVGRTANDRPRRSHHQSAPLAT
jgi:adenine-specific DNA-methyltransferase